VTTWATTRHESSPEPSASARAIETWPSYDTYQSRTERQIPVVVLDPKP